MSQKKHQHDGNKDKNKDKNNEINFLKKELKETKDALFKAEKQARKLQIKPIPEPENIYNIARIPDMPQIDDRILGESYEIIRRSLENISEEISTYNPAALYKKSEEDLAKEKTEIRKLGGQLDSIHNVGNQIVSKLLLRMDDLERSISRGDRAVKGIYSSLKTISENFKTFVEAYNNEQERLRNINAIYGTGVKTQKGYTCVEAPKYDPITDVALCKTNMIKEKKGWLGGIEQENVYDRVSKRDYETYQERLNRSDILNRRGLEDVKFVEKITRGTQIVTGDKVVIISPAVEIALEINGITRLIPLPVGTEGIVENTVGLSEGVAAKANESLTARILSNSVLEQAIKIYKISSNSVIGQKFTTKPDNVVLARNY